MRILTGTAAKALRGVVASTLLATTALGASAIVATPAVAQDARSYDIPAGPLPSVLSRFIEASGVAVVYDAPLAENATSPGLKGSYGAAEALSRILAGSGLTYRQTGSRAFTLEPAPTAAGTIQLGPVRVEGQGTGSASAIASAGEATPVSHVNGYVARRTATGTKTDTPLIEVPQSISVVTSDQLVAQNAQSITDALRYTAGISTNNNPSQDAVRIRGFFAFAQAGALYRDGSRMPPGGANGRNEPYGLERIEVLKGASSVLYGSAAPGGLINLVTKRPTDTAFGEVNLSYGRWERKQISGDIGGPVDKDASLTYRLTALLRDSDAFTDFVKDNRFYIAPAVTWKPAAGTELTLLGQYQYNLDSFNNFLPARGTVLPNPNGRIPRNRYLGEPGDFHRTRSYAAGYLFSHEFSSDLTFKSNLRYSKNEMSLVNSSGSNNPDFVSAADLTHVARRVYKRSDDIEAVTLDNSLNWKGATGPIAHTIIVGTDFTSSRFDSLSFFQAIAPLDAYHPTYGAQPGAISSRVANRQYFRFIGLYAQDQMKIAEKLVVLLGGRYDWSKNKLFPIGGASTPYREWKAFSGRAGLVYLTDIGIAPFLSFSQSFEPQSGFDRLNRSFDPTRGEQYEAGIRYQPKDRDLLISASIYQLAQTNVLTPDPVDNRFNVQTGEVRSRGAEVEAKGHLASNLSAIASYTYIDSKITKSNRPAEIGQPSTATPSHQAALWLDYAFENILPGPLKLGGGVRYVGHFWAQNSVDNKSTFIRMPDFTLFDLGLSYEAGRLRYSVNVSNLTDKHYVDSCQTTCAWGEPRQIVATIGFRW